jgi:Flp pilus assembly protein CpaB
MPASSLDQRTPAPPARRLLVLVRRVRREVLVRRRLLAACLAGLAVLTGFRAVAAPPEPTTEVVVARRDLPGGSVVAAGDLRTAAYGEDDVPDGARSEPESLAGRVLAAPVRRGEPVTDVRLVAPGLLEGYPGLVAAPVRVADAGAVTLLRVGDHVDLLAADPRRATATVLVAAAPVVAIPDLQDQDTGIAGAAGSGGLLVVAVTDAEAVALASASVTSVLSVVLDR